MRIYICITRGQGLELLKKTTQGVHYAYTNKQRAIREFRQRHAGYIRDCINKEQYGKFSVMLFSLDVPDEKLIYYSGDELEPFITEYDLKMDTVFLYDLKNHRNDEIISMESWYYRIHKNRLKPKKEIAFR